MINYKKIFIRKYKLLLLVIFLGIITWQYKYYDFQNRLYLAAVDVLKEEVKHYEEASSSAQATISSLSKQLEDQQDKINSFSCPPTPKLTCPTPAPQSTPTSIPLPTPKVSDNIVDCKIHADCGGGSIRVDKDVCSHMYCCQIPWGYHLLTYGSGSVDDWCLFVWQRTFAGRSF